MRRALCVLVLLCACRDDWSPRADQERADRARAADLERHLEALPGVTHASVLYDAPRADPLAPPAEIAPPRASVVLALAPGVDADATSAAARRTIVGAVRDLAERDVAVTAVAAPPAAVLASVGPFHVAPDSRGPLLATLVGALLVILGLAAWIVGVGLRRRRPSDSYPRRGTRPQ